MSWDGEKTLTFTMEDALITTDSLALLAAAKGKKMSGEVHTQKRLGVSDKAQPDESYVYINTADKTITLNDNDALGKVAGNGLVYVLAADEGGFNSEPFLFTVNSLKSEAIYKLLTEKPSDWETQYATYYTKTDETTYSAVTAGSGGKAPTFEVNKYYTKVSDQTIEKTSKDGGKTLTACPYDPENGAMKGYSPKDLKELENATAIYLDYYTTGHGFTRLTIEPDSFGSNFYIEAETLFRDDSGADYAAIFTIPNCRVQSNFTITMASSGDPSSFTFTIDAFPGYTRFDPSKKVLAAIDIKDAVHGLTNDKVYRIKTNEDTK